MVDRERLSKLISCAIQDEIEDFEGVLIRQVTCDRAAYRVLEVIRKENLNIVRLNPGNRDDRYKDYKAIE